MFVVIRSLFSESIFKVNFLLVSLALAQVKSWLGCGARVLSALPE